MKKYIFAWIAIFAITATTCKDDKKEKPTVQTDGVSAVTEYTATVNGNVLADGGEALIARGVCYNVRPQPTIEQTKIEERENIGTGSFSANLTGLTHNTKYYVRAYARNAMGTTYGDEIEFTTLRIFEAPVVTTVAAANVDLTTATVGGNVTDDGGKPLTAVGVVYSEEENPTLETASKVFAASNVIGAFACNIADLKEATTYYYKAFATNEKGTTYGAQMSFTSKATQAQAPTVITSPVVTKAIVSAVLPGRITSTGGAEIIRRGVCWTDSPTDLPDADLDTKAEDNMNASGDFSFFVAPVYTISGSSQMVPDYPFQANTEYRFRAYAENSAGISYGDVVSFTTDKGGEMILVTAGTFQMGASISEIPDESHAVTLTTLQGVTNKHAVTISKNYYIGKYEVTNWEFAEFLNDIGASPVSSHAVAQTGTYAGKTLWYNYASGVPNSAGVWQPAEDRVTKACGGISWTGAMAYCEWLSQKTGKKYRLPTEAEWEFAARGGNSSEGYLYSGSNERDDVTVTDLNNQLNIRTPGTKKPNELGIYDMSGNLIEFVSDYLSLTYYNECAAGVTDPTGPATPEEEHATLGAYRIMRGGYYFNDLAYTYYVFGRFAATNVTWNTTLGSAAVRTGFRWVMEVD